MNRKATLLLILLTLSVVPAAHADIANQEEVRQFIGEMVTRHDFQRDWLEQQFRHATMQTSIIEAITRPAEAKPWFEYRPIFLTQSRIRQGAAFWNKHRRILARAEREYGVPAAIIVAIIGVETLYGNYTGGYRVLDALSTLAFNYPPRARFFRSELEHFLLMAREEKIDPLDATGSYAGAMGQPQFIPSSFRAYAIDFNGDGRRDIWRTIEDVIGSVANYLHRHRWHPDAGIASRAQTQGDDYRQLLDSGTTPTWKAAEITTHGITARVPLNDTALYAVLELKGHEGPQVWLTEHNFYVITRYNRSSLYAMAVYQLSEAIHAHLRTADQQG